MTNIPQADASVKPPALFRIPAGTKPQKCLRCPATIFFVDRQPLRAEAQCHHVTKNVIISTPDAKRPTATEDGAGFSHFIDCPKAAEFRKGR